VSTRFRFEPLQVDCDGGWLSAVYKHAEPARMGLLMLPPHGHEGQRGYRLFALLAEALAEHGIASLRFDHRGCGDSSGSDDSFLLSRAAGDAEAALAALRRRCPAPVQVLGLRAGALLAAPLAAAHGLPLLLWQPVLDGADYWDRLQARDAAELNSRWRHPFLRGPRAREAGCLLGCRIHPDLEGEYRAARIDGRAALWLEAAGRAPEGQAMIALPPALSNWAGEIDLDAMFPPPQVRALSAELAGRLLGDGTGASA
jgi:alpha-beta hydrolase superfamily lysophospholipase